MIDPNDMKLAWNLYLALGVVAILLWILLLNGLRWGALRIWLTLAAVAFLFTPVEHSEVSGLWVPANTAAALNWIGNGLESALPALIALGAAQAVALLLSVLAFFLLRKSAKAPVAAVSTQAKVEVKVENARIEPSVGVDIGRKHASNVSE